MTDDERKMLDFETAHPDHGGRKMDAIWATFRYSPARYYQQVLALVHRPDVVAAYPQTCARVQRLETANRGRRERRSELRRAAA